MRLNPALCLAAACQLFTGCATVMNGRTQAVNVRTDPPGAICDVGPQRIMTPGVAVLSRKSEHVVICRLKGYQDAKAYLLREHQLRYAIGDILFFGGLAGLVMDRITAADELITPAIVEIGMTPEAAPTGP